MIKGKAASLVPRPTMIKMEQITSAETASINESSALMPNTAGKLAGAAEDNICIFGIPCVSIKNPIAILPINKARSFGKSFVSVENNFFIE